MSSGTVNLGASDLADGHLHVAYDRQCAYWWAVGAEGSYGGDPTKADALVTALSASATGWDGRRRIVVHYADGRVEAVITRTRRLPAAQFFQDAVP